MHRLFLAFFLIPLLLSCASRPAGSDGDDDPSVVIAAVEASERSRRTAALRGDIAAALEGIAPEFLFVHTTGDVDDLKAFQQFAARVGRSSPDETRVLEPPVYRVADNIAVRTQLTASRPRPTLPEAKFRSLDLYTLRDGRWIWLAHQSAMVEPPWRPVSVQPELLAEYSGKFVNRAGDVRIYEQRGDQLVQRSNQPTPTETRLIALSESAFATEGRPITHTFLRNRAGHITDVQVIGPLGLAVFHRE